MTILKSWKYLHMISSIWAHILLSDRVHITDNTSNKIEWNKTVFDLMITSWKKLST